MPKKDEKYAEAKAFLKQAKKLDKMIEKKMVEKKQWMAMALGMGSYSAGERVQTSGSQQKMADSIDKAVDAERAIDRYIDELVDTKKDILGVIEQLKESEYDFLHLVYIEGYELYEVAIMKKKSYSWATTIHSRALESVQNILEARRNEELQKNCIPCDENA